MKETFEGLKQFTEKEMKDLLKNSIIVLDTNVLLDFYRLSSKTSEELFTALNNYKKDIWLPYYAGIEFYKNKDGICNKTSTRLNDLVKDIKHSYNKILDKVSNECKDYKGNPDYDDSLKDLNKSKDNFDKIEKFAKDTEKKFNSSIEKIDKKVEELIDDNVTQKLDIEEFKEVLKEGQRRIELEVPPGYEDKGKNEYIYGYKVNGDYIIFDSIIKLSKEKGRDIVFITGDNKKDWYDSKNGRINYELQKEFFINTGNKILLINCTQFIDLHNKITKDKEERISNSSKKEIQNLNTINCISGSFAQGLTNALKPLKEENSLEIIKSMAQIEPYLKIQEIINKDELSKITEPLKELQNNMKILFEVSKIKDELQGFNIALNKLVSNELKNIDTSLNTEKEKQDS